MTHEDDFPDTEIEEITFPIDHGYSLYVLRKFCDTDDEKFLCTLYDPKGNIVPMDDPTEEAQHFYVDTVKVFPFPHMLEVFENAERRVDLICRAAA